MRYRRAQCIPSLCPPLSAPRFDFSCLHCTVKDPAAREGALPPADHGEEESGELARINPNKNFKPLKCKRFDILTKCHKY